MFQKQEQVFMKPDWTSFCQPDEKQKKKAIPMPQKSFFSVGAPVIQRKVYHYEGGQWIAVRDKSTLDRVDPNAKGIPGEEGQYYDGATEQYVNKPTVMAGAIIRAKNREQHRFEVGAAPRNHAEALSHISMGSYLKSDPLPVQTPTGTALWKKSFYSGPGAMSHEKQPYVFQENQTLSSTYTALSQVMDEMEPEDRRISLEAMMRFFRSNDPIESVELPTATSEQREAATLMTAILAAENHVTRTPVGGKLQRAVICMLQSGGTFHQALNSTNGDFVQSQIGGNKVMRETLSKPSTTPARFQGMGRMLDYMSDSSDEEDEEMEPPQPFSFESDEPVSPSPLQEQISLREQINDSRQHIERQLRDSSIPIEEQLVVQYILLLHSSSDLFDNEPEGMADFLYNNVYLRMDRPDDIALEAMNVLADFIQRHWYV